MIRGDEASSAAAAACSSFLKRRKNQQKKRWRKKKTKKVATEKFGVTATDLAADFEQVSLNEETNPVCNFKIAVVDAPKR